MLTRGLGCVQSPKCSEETMAQLGQAFLHASLLGTEAEATRLREIKAEYFRQKQQRAAGEIGLRTNMHMLHGLQHRVSCSSMRLLQLRKRPPQQTCCKTCSTAWAAAIKVCGRTVWPLKRRS